jgi:hypothetical protein
MYIYNQYKYRSENFKEYLFPLWLMTGLCLLASFGIGFVTYSFLAFLLNITLTAALSNFYVIIPSIFVVWLSAMIIAKYDLFFDDKVEVYFQFKGYSRWEILFCLVLLASLLTSLIVSYFAGFNFLTTFLVCYMSFRLLSKLLYNSKFFKNENNYLFKLICSLLISILVIMPIFGAKILFLGVFSKGFVLFSWSDFLNLALSSFSNPLCWLIGLICFLFIANIMISFSYEYMDEFRKYNFLKSFFQEITSEITKFSLFLGEQNEISLNFLGQFLQNQDQRDDFRLNFLKKLANRHNDIDHPNKWYNYFYARRVEFFERVANFYGLSYYLARCIKNDELNIYGNEEVLRQYLKMSKEFKTIDENLSSKNFRDAIYSELVDQESDYDYDLADKKTADHLENINFKQLEKQIESGLACHELSFNELQNYMPNDLAKKVMHFHSII